MPACGLGNAALLLLLLLLPLFPLFPDNGLAGGPPAASPAPPPPLLFCSCCRLSISSRFCWRSLSCLSRAKRCCSSALRNSFKKRGNATQLHVSDTDHAKICDKEFVCCDMQPQQTSSSRSRSSAERMPVYLTIKFRFLQNGHSDCAGWCGLLTCK